MFLAIAAAWADPALYSGTVDGLEVHATPWSEPVSGYPVLVPITVQNTGSAPKSFPDLASRPWLVHFTVKSPDGKESERYTTPPSTDPGQTWTIPAGGRRSLLLEIPSSAAFGPGRWQLGIRLTSPAVDLGTGELDLAVAAPVAGAPSWEPAVATSVGATLPFVQPGRSGASLWALQWAAGGKFEAAYPLASLARPVEPVLSRARPADARSRWIYWQEGRSLRRVRIVGSETSKIEEVTAPYPRTELLGRGVTDPSGSLSVPVWVPAPQGEAGSVQLLVIDERNQLRTRPVADLPARPTVSATAVDAAGQLLLLLGHAAGLDLYRASPSDPATLPVKGVRVARLVEGQRALGAGFATLPERESRPGGLAVFGLVEGVAADGRKWVTRLLADLGGSLFDRAPELPSTLPGPAFDLLPNGYGGWAALGRDAEGTWVSTQGAPARRVEVPGTATAALLGGNHLRLRWIGGPKVYQDLDLGAMP